MPKPPNVTPRTLCLECPQGHPLATHVGPEGGCRMNHCPCTHFRSEPKKPGKPTSERTFTMEIPAGYVLNVQLVPIEAAVIEEQHDGS